MRFGFDSIRLAFLRLFVQTSIEYYCFRVEENKNKD